jgi:hypothetical protein
MAVGRLTKGKKFIAVAYATGYVNVIKHRTGNFQSFHDSKQDFRSNPVLTSDEVSRRRRAVAAAFSLSLKNQACGALSGSKKNPTTPVIRVIDPSIMNSHCHPFTAGSLIWNTPKEMSPLKADARTANDCMIAKRNPISPRV